MSPPAQTLHVQHRASLRVHNSFGLPSLAATLVHIRGEDDLRQVIADPTLGPAPKFILGGGSNVVLTRDVQATVLKVEVAGRRVVEERPDAWIVEAGAGENWPAFVEWTVEQGLHGLENLALIPGSVGAAPVQNIGAYGVELKDRFESLDAVDLGTGRSMTLDAAGLRLRLPRQRLQAPLGRQGGDRARALPAAAALAAGAGLPGPGAQDRRDGEHPPRCAHDLRLGLRHPPRQAARPGGDRQRRQLLQEPGRQRRAVPRHHRPRPGDRALPAARRHA